MAQQTANEALLDAMVRHQTYLLRYSGYVRNRINGLLDRTEPAIAQAVAEKLARGTGLSTPAEVRRLNSLLRVLEGIRTRAWTNAAEFLSSQMVELAYQEPVQVQGFISAVAPVTVTTVLPQTPLLRAVALARPFEGRLLKDWAKNLETEDLRRVRAAVQLGMVSGETAKQITSRIVGDEALAYRNGVTHATRQQVQAVVRTAVAHVANSARNEMMLLNSDIITQELYVATLDARTTPVCRGHDGKRFPLGSGPRPPLHMQCRSLRVAVLDGDVLSGRPAKAVTEKQLLREFGEARGIPTAKSRDALPRGTKGAFDAFARKRTRELTGRVPASTSYQQWLMKQTHQFQEDTLGIAKAKLFRNGGLTLDKFVARDGTELTLGELAKKHADAFRAAGLDPAGF